MPKINLCQTTIIILLSLVGTNAQPNYNYVGGIPLRTPKTCPQGSVSGQITFQQNCCGADQTFVKLEGSACCANSTDCYDEVIAAPKCADPSWQLCGTDQGGFCCEQNWVCWSQPVAVAGTPGNGVGCSSPGAVLKVGQTSIPIVYSANSGPGTSSTVAAPVPTTQILLLPVSSTTSLPTALSPIISGPTIPSFITSSSMTPSSITPTSTPSELSSLSSSQPTSSVEISSISSTSQGPQTVVLSSTTALSSSTDSVTPPTPSASNNATSPFSPSSSSKSSIGKGTIASIVIAGAVILGIAITSGIWFSKRRRIREPKSVLLSSLSASSASQYTITPPSVYSSIEIAQSNHSPPRGAELHSTPASYEMSANERSATELPVPPRIKLHDVRDKTPAPGRMRMHDIRDKTDESDWWI